MTAGIAASFTMVVSGTIVNVAVPDVMGSFGVGLEQAQLMTSAFNIAMVTSQLLSAWIVSALGQRGGFLLMVLIFVTGSFIAGIGQDFNMVVVGRVLQGVAAGVIQPLTDKHIPIPVDQHDADTGTVRKARDFFRSHSDRALVQTRHGFRRAARYDLSFDGCNAVRPFRISMA